MKQRTGRQKKKQCNFENFHAPCTNLKHDIYHKNFINNSETRFLFIMAISKENNFTWPKELTDTSQ